MEDRKRWLYGQVFKFWEWLKVHDEVPITGDVEAAFHDITSSAALLYDESQPLLNELLIVGVSYLQDDWKRRKEHD